jgi:hypothetical protein
LHGVTTRWDAPATLRLRTGVGVGVGDVPLVPTAVVSAVDRMADVLMAAGSSMSLSFGTIGWPRRLGVPRLEELLIMWPRTTAPVTVMLSRRDGGGV